MLAACPSQTASGSVQQEEQGSCDEMEDFVKSFIPSLFVPDSDTEEDYFFQANGDPGSSFGMPQISRTLHLPLHNSAGSGPAGSKLVAEAGSPTSQEDSSSLSAFQLTALDTPSSLDEQSTFQSMLSIASNTTSFDISLEDERPSKKAKVAPPPSVREARATGNSPGAAGHSNEQPAPLPRPPSLQCLAPQPVAASARSPADAPAAQIGTLPQAAPWTTSPPPPPTLPSPRCRGFPAPAGQWSATQSMLPPANPSVQPQPPALRKDITAALAQLMDPSMAAPPLGLMLDKPSVVRRLREMGMTVIDS